MRPMVSFMHSQKAQKALWKAKVGEVLGVEGDSSKIDGGKGGGLSATLPQFLHSRLHEVSVEGARNSKANSHPGLELWLC